MQTLFYIDHRVEFNDKDNLGKSPLNVFDKFHSEFQIKSNEYQDRNNFLVHKKCVTHDERFFGGEPGEFEFFNL